MKKEKMRRMFMDCISDDLIYIRQFMTVAVDGRSINFIHRLCIPALCRMLIVSSVSGIDFDLNYSEDFYGDISSQYDNELIKLIQPVKEKHITNVKDYLKSLENKIDSFSSFARGKAFEIPDETIRDFLAIRMIRNAIVHSSWENSQIRDEKKKRIESIARRRFILRSKFKTNLMRLDLKHWNKINNAEQSFLNFSNGNKILKIKE